MITTNCATASTISAHQRLGLMESDEMELLLTSAFSGLVVVCGLEANSDFASGPGAIAAVYG